MTLRIQKGGMRGTDFRYHTLQWMSRRGCILDRARHSPITPELEQSIGLCQGFSYGTITTEGVTHPRTEGVNSPQSDYTCTVTTGPAPMLSFPAAFPLALLQAAAMCLAQLLPGFSFALALHVAPSLFAMATIEQYYRRTCGFDMVWLIGASVWTGIACGAPTPYWYTSGTAGTLRVLSVLLCLGTIGFQGWARGVYASALARIVVPLRAQEGRSRLVIVTAAGEMRPVLQPSVPRTALSAVSVALGGYGVLLACATWLCGVVLASGTPSASWQNGLEGLFVVALYVALAVVSGDLMHDVWPGTTSRAALLRAFMYYVYLFEQWRNWAIPGALLAVMILSIAFVVQGTVAWLFLGFPVWSVGCIGFAILWNVLLHRRGGVRQRLPVPLGKNSYSAVDPLWAHFVTVMHIVMALCLIADVVALNVRIFGA